MSTVSKHAFPKKDCSMCPVKKGRIKERERLTEEIKFLGSMNIPTPKAQANLERIQGRLRDCAFNQCEGHQ